MNKLQFISGMSMYRLLKTNFPFFLPYFSLILIGAALQLYHSKTDLFFFINGNHHSVADYFFRYFTHIGDGLFYLLIVVLLALVSYRKAAIALSCYLASSIVAQLLKRLAFPNELRPKAFFENSTYVVHAIDDVTLHSYNSFPSGHATTAFSLFCLLSIFTRNKQIGFVWFCLALLASYSRVYLSQHFFADVYAGSIIGVVVTLGMYYGMNIFFKRKSKKWLSRGLMEYVK